MLGIASLLALVRGAPTLAEAMTALLTDRARRATMGRAGRALAERAFRAEAVAEHHLALYARLAGQRCAG